MQAYEYIKNGRTRDYPFQHIDIFQKFKIRSWSMGAPLLHCARYQVHTGSMPASICLETKVGVFIAGSQTRSTFVPFNAIRKRKSKCPVLLLVRGTNNLWCLSRLRVGLTPAAVHESRGHQAASALDKLCNSQHDRSPFKEPVACTTPPPRHRRSSSKTRKAGHSHRLRHIPKTLPVLL